MQNAIYFSNSTEPYYNLALEEVLFSSIGEGCTLYLWQNQNTVVVGKNQNAWKECRISLLEQESGKLARRSSGGGAVFHDLGNLNFTFLLARGAYDVEKQLGVIQRACASFGVETEFTGRNDLTVSASGAKFSGNAFRFTDDKAMHHGTVLVDVDIQKMSRYLAPPPEKLKAKGVDSVRARVTNLNAVCADITTESMKRALVEAFIQVYGPSRRATLQAVDRDALSAAQEKYASWEWRLGNTPQFDIVLERRFDFGNIELMLSLQKGRIMDIRAYSDAMDEAFVARIAPALLGALFSAEDMAARLIALDDIKAQQIAAWIDEKGF